MKEFLVLHFVLSIVLADTNLWTDLRVKYNPPGVVSRFFDKSYFDIPSDIDTAYRFNWTLIQNKNELNLRSVGWQGRDYRILSLYDDNGWIAGIQIAVNKYDIDKTRPPSYDMSKIGVFETKEITGIPVYASTVYFVDPNVLKRGGRTSAPSLGDGLWIKKGTKYTKVSDDIKDLEVEGYVKQTCIPAMGTQYYFIKSSLSDCVDWQPFILLTSEGSVTGIGWQIFGTTTHDERNWWDPVTWMTTLVAVPDSNRCLANYVVRYKAFAVFFFFTRQPWNTVCTPKLFGS